MVDRTGQIGLCTTTGFFGWLIRTVTRSHVNHVVVGIGGGVVVSAEPRGVCARPESHWPPIVWSEFPETPVQRRQVARFVSAQVGKPYDFVADVAIGVALLTRERTPRWLSRYLRSDDRFQCAQLADAALQHAGVHVFRDDRPAAAVFPGSFVPVFKDFGWIEGD